MLPLPDRWTPWRLVGIDPGTEACGYAFMEVDPYRRSCTLCYVETLMATRHIQYGQRYEGTYHTMGYRQARLQGIESMLFANFQRHRPDVIACETPFMYRQAEAFEALVECLQAIRYAMRAYDPLMPFTGIAPIQAKAAIGQAKAGGDKTLIKKTLREYFIQDRIQYRYTEDPDTIDDHGYDAIAVAYCHAQQWLECLP